MSTPTIATCQILGNLAKEPDFRRTSSGNAFCELSVAVNQTGKNGQDEVSFIDVTVWGKPAESCRQFLSKGSKVYVDGYLRQERWKDRNTGSNRSRLRVSCEKILFLTKREEGNGDYQHYQPREEVKHESLAVDPQYAPEPPKARFYGDPGAIPAMTAVDSTEEEADGIPF